MLLRCAEGNVFLARKEIGCEFVEQFAQVCYLEAIDLSVFYGGQGVKFFTLFLVKCISFFTRKGG